MNEEAQKRHTLSAIQKATEALYAGTDDHEQREPPLPSVAPPVAYQTDGLSSSPLHSSVKKALRYMAAGRCRICGRPLDRFDRSTCSRCMEDRVLRRWAALARKERPHQFKLSVMVALAVLPEYAHLKPKPKLPPPPKPPKPPKPPPPPKIKHRLWKLAQAGLVDEVLAQFGYRPRNSLSSQPERPQC